VKIQMKRKICELFAFNARVEAPISNYLLYNGLSLSCSEEKATGKAGNSLLTERNVQSVCPIFSSEILYL
jgi:hypothetical protein